MHASGNKQYNLVYTRLKAGDMVAGQITAVGPAEDSVNPLPVTDVTSGRTSGAARGGPGSAGPTPKPLNNPFATDSCFPALST